MEVLFVSVSLLDPFLQLFWGHQNFFTSLLQASLQPLWLMFNRRPTWLILVFVSLPVLWRNQKLKSKLKSNFTKNLLTKAKSSKNSLWRSKKSFLSKALLMSALWSSAMTLKVLFGTFRTLVTAPLMTHSSKSVLMLAELSWKSDFKSWTWKKR